LSQKKTFPLDPRPAALLERYHRRTRKRAPWLQVVLFTALSPVVLLLSRVRIHGREHIPDGGFILAPNHPSQLDAFFAAVALGRRVRFMAKSDLFTRRWGRWLARVGAFPVRRGVWDEDAFETAATLLERGKVLAMFFEGGVSPAGGYRDAKPGIGYVARRAGATVLPCHLSGTRGLYRPWTWPRITVTYGPPLVFERDPDPTREANAGAAEQIADAVKALAP
jgi:1-acyl-sn-glycerol-3-phosphate acyltransferase